MGREQGKLYPPETKLEEHTSENEREKSLERAGMSTEA
jgi:hypothetical protein